jgi:hypothetical protein
LERLSQVFLDLLSWLGRGRMRILGWSSLVVVLAVTIRLSGATTTGDKKESWGRPLLLSTAVLLLFLLK